MLVLLIGTVIVSYSRYTVEVVHGTEALGIYQTVTLPAILVQVAAGMLFTPLANLFAESLKEGSKKKFIKIFTISSVAIAGITVAFLAVSYFFGEWGLNIIFGESIIPYAYLLPGAAIIAGLTASMWFMNIVFAATRDIKGILVGNLIGVVICLATAGMFLRNFGLAGANHVMIAGQGAAVICLLIRLLWFIKKKPGLFAGSGQ